MKTTINGVTIEGTTTEFRELLFNKVETPKVITKTIFNGTRKHKPWSMEEKIFVEANINKSGKWLANRLHRTTGGVYEYRSKLLRGTKSVGQ